MAASVAVVGAGVCGLSMAVCILQRDPTVRVTVIADKFSPDTCTDGAAGVILPVTAVKSFELQRFVALFNIFHSVFGRSSMQTAQ